MQSFLQAACKNVRAFGVSVLSVPLWFVVPINAMAQSVDVDWLEAEPGRYNASPLSLAVDLHDRAFDRPWKLLTPDEARDLRQAAYYENHFDYRREAISRDSDFVDSAATIYRCHSLDAVEDLREKGATLRSNEVRGVWLIGPTEQLGRLDSLQDLQALFLMNGYLNFRGEEKPDKRTGWAGRGEELSNLLKLQISKQILVLQLPAGKATCDELLEDVARLDQLLALSLWNTAVTNDGMEKLQSLVRLQVLNLDGTSVSNPAIERLAAHPELRSISLNGTKITRASIDSFARFPKLFEVRLWGTAFTDDDVKLLQKKAPNIKYVTHGDD